MPTRVVTAARQADGWYLTATHEGAPFGIGFARRIVDADRICAEFFPPGTVVDLRIATPPRAPRTTPTPAPAKKSHRGGSGRSRLR